MCLSKDCDAISIPKKILKTSIPAKFLAATVRIVKAPKHPIRIGNTLAGPNFFPNIAYISSALA
jgi:hypothetical protein